MGFGKGGNEIVKTYEIDGKHYDVTGCYSNETPERDYDFFDVVCRETGETINEGEPFETVPTENEIKAQLEINAEMAE